MKILLFILLFTSASAYESQDKLKVIIIGKVAKYVKWKDNKRKKFIITILDKKADNLFEKIYKNRKLKNKPVRIKYIKKIDELEATDILYISPINAYNLANILEKTHNKNILTVSDIKSFTQKGGIMQIYFSSQKVKLKINVGTAKLENLKFKSSLLRIVIVIKGETL